MLLKLFYNDGFVFMYEGFHDKPCDEVSNGTDTEDDHITGLFAFESHEAESCSQVFGMGKQRTSTFVDEERTDTSRHTADTGDGCDGAFGEHVADGREDIGRPRLVRRAAQTDQDDREPRRDRAHGLRQQHQQRNEREDQHGAHACRIGVQPRLVDDDRRKLAAVDRQHRDGIKCEDQRHAQPFGHLDPKLRIEVRGGPEEEEPPHAVGHKLAEGEGPRLFERKRSPERDLLALLLLADRSRRRPLRADPARYTPARRHSPSDGPRVSCT